ncbi:MAG: hypothetical protein J0H74_13895 [Chitinophagaceae bacterium]|nr:hypothetical protein [Chitinophagaceae bacterium]
MALPPKEVRYRKNTFYLFLAIAIIPMAIVSCAVFTAKPFWLLYVSYIFTLLMMFFIFRHLILKTRSNTPVLIFESHALTINSRRTRTIPWSAITQWKIKSYKGNDALIIRTFSGKVSVQITWLELSTSEIKWLMESYIRQPGPGH